MNFRLGEKFNQLFIISEATFKGFGHLFNDRHPLHTDEQFAIEKGFKGKIMHGNILSGFLSHFIGECLPTKDIIIHSQEIQFKNAVYLNDELQFKAVINSIYDQLNVIEFKFDFRNIEEKIVAKGKFQIGLLA